MDNLMSMDDLKKEFQRLAAAYERALAIGRTRLLEECMTLYQAQQGALCNGHSGDVQLVRRQRLLERMMGIGDYYVLHSDGDITPAYHA